MRMILGIRSSSVIGRTCFNPPHLPQAGKLKGSSGSHFNSEPEPHDQYDRNWFDEVIPRHGSVVRLSYL